MTHLLLLALLPLPGLAGEPTREAPGLTASGDFCEVVWSRSRWERVSCFALSRDAGGVTLEGTAYSWARTRDEEVVAPRLATWRLDRVLSFDAADQTLVYAYSGTMTSTGEAFEGTSTVRLDVSTEPTPSGWYGIGDERVRFRLLPLADLEACLGHAAPLADAAARYRRVATTLPETLATCVPEAP